MNCPECGHPLPHPPIEGCQHVFNVPTGGDSWTCGCAYDPDVKPPNAGFPVEPGSDLDRALDTRVRHLLNGGGDMDLDAWRLIALDDSGHMLALGTRLSLYLMGVHEPSSLTEPMFMMWYGQAVD